MANPIPGRFVAQRQMPRAKRWVDIDLDDVFAYVSYHSQNDRAEMQAYIDNYTARRGDATRLVYRPYRAWQREDGTWYDVIADILSLREFA